MVEDTCRNHGYLGCVRCGGDNGNSFPSSKSPCAAGGNAEADIFFAIAAGRFGDEVSDMSGDWQRDLAAERKAAHFGACQPCPKVI